MLAGSALLRKCHISALAPSSLASQFGIHNYNPSRRLLTLEPHSEDCLSYPCRFKGVGTCKCWEFSLLSVILHSQYHSFSCWSCSYSHRYPGFSCRVFPRLLLNIAVVASQSYAHCYCQLADPPSPPQTVYIVADITPTNLSALERPR